MKLEIIKGLFIGNWDQDWQQLYDEGIHTVVRVTNRGKVPRKYWPGTILKWRFEDKEELPDIIKLEATAEYIAALITGGESVMVQCGGALNRSALVIGEALKAIGVSGDDVLALLRHIRGPNVLNNETFERRVLS